jgi:hypothetical protein
LKGVSVQIPAQQPSFDLSCQNHLGGGAPSIEIAESVPKDINNGATINTMLEGVSDQSVVHAVVQQSNCRRRVVRYSVMMMGKNMITQDQSQIRHGDI